VYKCDRVAVKQQQRSWCINRRTNIYIKVAVLQYDKQVIGLARVTILVLPSTREVPKRAWGMAFLSEA